MDMVIIPNGFIIESNDSAALACIGWAIEKHLDEIPSQLKPKFQKILEDTRIRKENLERSYSNRFSFVRA